MADKDQGEANASAIPPDIARRLEILFKGLANDDPWVRSQSVEALGNYTFEPYIKQPLMQVLASESASIRISAAEVLRGIDEEAAIDALAAEINRPDNVYTIKLKAIALLSIFEQAAVPTLAAALHDAHSSVRQAAARSLTNIKGEEFVENLNKQVNVKQISEPKRGQENPVPSLDDRIKELTALPPEDYDGRVVAASALNSTTRRVMAEQLAPALNAHIQTMPHETYEEKKALATWVNEEVERFGLAVKCPKTGLPAKLRGHAGNWPGIGRFAFEVYMDGKRKVPAYSDNLPELQLTDVNLSQGPETPEPESETPWQDEVGPKSSRRGRKLS